MRTSLKNSKALHRPNQSLTQPVVEFLLIFEHARFLCLRWSVSSNRRWQPTWAWIFCIDMKSNAVPTPTKSRGKIYMIVFYSLKIAQLFWCTGQTFTQLSLSKALLCKQINSQWRRKKKDCTFLTFKNHKNIQILQQYSTQYSEKHNLWSLSSKRQFISHVTLQRWK